VSGSLSGMSGQNVRRIRTYTRSVRVTVTGLENQFGPESPDPYVRSIRTYTRSFRVPLFQRLVSGRGGINTPHTPLTLSLLLIFDQTCRKPKESPLTPHLLHSWVIFVGVWSEIVARAKIVQVSLDFISWAHQTKSSPWILVYYSWSFKLLDG
jgi:hypothetical protein